MKIRTIILPIILLAAISFSSFGSTIDEYSNPFLIPKNYGQKIHKYLRDKYLNLSTSTTEFTFTPVKLGIDDGLIASAKVSFLRRVEKNVSPTGQDDQFIVRDSLQLKFEAGAGIVIRGILQKVLEYNIIYPVKNNRDGILHNSFILDFLIPQKLKNMNFPKKSIVFFDSYFYKKGELKLSTPYQGIVNLIVRLSKGDVKFNRKVLNFKEQDVVKIFTDSGVFPVEKKELDAEIFFIETDLYKTQNTKGRLKRQYYELAYKKVCEIECKSILKDFIFNNKNNTEQIIHKSNMKSDFNSFDKKFNLLGLIRNHVNEKAETITYKDKRFSIIEKDHVFKWNAVIDGERFYDQLKIVMDPVDIIDDPYTLNNARAEITLIIDDYTITNNELNIEYLPMINQITLDNTFISDPPDFTKKKGYSSRGYIQLQINIDNVALNKLVSMSEEEYWKNIFLLTGYRKETWYNISKYKLDLEYLKKNKRAYKYSKRELKSARNFFKFWRNIQKAKKQSNTLKKLKNLKNALSNAIYRSGDIYVPDIISLINQISGTEHFYLNVEIMRFALPENDENQFDRILSLDYGNQPDRNNRHGTQVFTVNDFFHNYENLK